MHTTPAAHRLLLTCAVLATATAMVVAVLVADARTVPADAAANPRTPGTFTGLGFDQCNAPSQKAMNAWRKHSPFRAVGIYISGNSRFCREQANLTPTWVRKQLAKGWHLLPITLGPQASCQPRFPRYGPKIDPTIRTKAAGTYSRARAQARAEADTAVAAARALGIVPGSTLFYDLEGFDLNHSTACTRSAKWFLSSWSNRLHAHGYLSGVYSSAGSGIAMLDAVRRNKPDRFVLPDLLWIARWDGKANTSAPGYLSDAGWSDHQRVKQFRGGHDETHGGVRINIDRNYLDVRNRRVPEPVPEPGATAAPTPGPTPGPSPTDGPTSLADPKCTGSTISLAAYRRTTATVRPWAIVPLQCLLKQQRLYVGSVTGTWNRKTTRALASFQAGIHRREQKAVNRAVWLSLITAGAGDTVLRRGDSGPDVVRLQRALNAATSARLKVSGSFDKATRRAVVGYQGKVLGSSTGVVAAQTWRALHGGRR